MLLSSLILLSAALSTGPAAPQPSPLPQQGRSAAAPQPADRVFLRALADHLEAERTAVHAVMSAPAGHAAHGGPIDPATWDGLLDMQQRQALALLQHDYRERYTPRATPRPSGTPDVSKDARGATAGGESDHERLAGLLHHGMDMIDTFMPRLRRASTRDLARRARTTHARILQEVGTVREH